MAFERVFSWLANLFAPDPLGSNDIAAYCRREGVDPQELGRALRAEVARRQDQKVPSPKFPERRDQTLPGLVVGENGRS